MVAGNLSKLEGEMLKKERVWKLQLEAKEREAKKLRDTLQKRDVVREMNQQQAQWKQRLGQHATTTNGYKTRQHAMDLRVRLSCTESESLICSLV